ncbi:MAG: hypothetical protein WCK18_20425 [Prolixibacteraceae bacterium]|jgi:hypothetical protein
MKELAIAFCLVITINVCLAQSRLDFYHIKSNNTAFPDSGRRNGHVYNGVLYSAEEHYSGSQVLIIVPQNFHPIANVDLVFWFHGWNNNIDSAVVRFGLARQFDESGINAVLVLAETTKDAPDSYGGKLEQPDTFRKLIQDVLNKLYEEKIVQKNCTSGNVILAGHSGAYRVIAHILQNGNVAVNEVILFDALYAETDKFMKWQMADNDHRFINLYTDHGGTFDESQGMLKQIRDLKLSAESIDEADLTRTIVERNKILLIHSLHEHNDIIQHPDNLKLFLNGSPFLRK